MKGFCHKKALLLFLILMPQSWGQKFTFGTCPALASLTTFTFADLVTTAWIVYAQTPTLYFHYWNCITYTGTAVTVGSQYSIAISGINKLTGTPLSTTATISVGGSAAATGTLVASAGTFLTFTIPNAWNSSTVNYYVIGYSSGVYLVLYSCVNVGFGKIENTIVLISSTATTANINTALTTLSTEGYPLHALRRSYVGCT